jgi:hypothetical protein
VLAYFDELGLNPRSIRLVLVTHWDDDHIRGIAEIVGAAAEATVAVSAALGKREILAFVNEQSALGGGGSGVSELREVLRIVPPRGTPLVWAKANTMLHPLPPGAAPEVIALSPSDDAVGRSLEALIEGATGAESTVPRRYRAPEGPNGASVAASVQKDDCVLLLGADLETSANPDAGWDAVLTYAAPARAASVVKVPHHASAGADHDGIWERLAEPEPVAIVTPWSRGASFLPTEEDLVRLSAVSDKIYVTAVPSLGRAHKDPAVEKLIRRLHGERVQELRGWGHVRARRRPGEPEWRVETAGDATRVTN